MASALDRAPSAGAAPSVQTQEPVRVRVGVYLLRVGALDIGAGTFSLDFYLTFTCDRPCETDGFEFTNGRTASVNKQDDLPQYKVYRVLAELSASFDLRSFPFDRHRLSLSLEDQLKPAGELLYVVDPERSGVDPNLIVAGWDVHRDWQRPCARSSTRSSTNRTRATPSISA